MTLLHSSQKQSILGKTEKIHAANTIEDLRIPPGSRLEQLGGDRRGQHGVRVDPRWRVRPLWRIGGMGGIELVDCH
ncbi:type II toxin-antitoxin system RelE/ParE family toxin [Corynebacterium pacaense]|uniref:type II toxin-antitoxin system RelE/ParE family toxin n=1 Tax=Corynebacterium pacaense TaxID=1816684 RepID=UPI0009BA2BE3